MTATIQDLHGAGPDPADDGRPGTGAGIPGARGPADGPAAGAGTGTPEAATAAAAGAGAGTAGAVGAAAADAGAGTVSGAGTTAAAFAGTEAEADAEAGALQDFGPGIDPERLALCLAVLAELDTLPVDHPDAIAVRRATAGIYRTVKQRRRQERRAAKTANDKAVTEATATGAADRIDDETLGIQLTTSVTTELAGILQRPRSCYVCKTRYVEVDAFYHQLCPTCAAENRARRDARTDLTGRRALLTGGRAKIGMYIALRLLRDGAHTTITTRFPNDAIRRFTAMPDSADWLHRLKIVGIDLRDPAQVVALADSVAAAGPLDILINNAAQTVRRSPRAYSELVAAEAAPLPAGELPAAEVIGAFGSGAQVPAALPSPTGAALTPDDVTGLALVSGSATPARIEAGTAIDAGGLVPDLDATNTWVQTVDEVDPVELLEVQLCNVTAPFILVSRLRPAMAAAAARRKYVVNVSAMEGQFGRGYKGAGHPHTNMAKASLNMLTRTSAQEMLERDGILMTAVDTGWITDERPHPDKVRLAEAGFHAPLDLVDGAARVYDPIVRGEQGEDLFGCFLKDYRPSPW
jgi:NAD(P)-dependent dehydrogenase (short-subunit alcohol dehydrogenase family)